MQASACPFPYDMSVNIPDIYIAQYEYPANAPDVKPV
jgi:hypothetical protein